MRSQRVVFAVYVAVIGLGLVYFMALGLAHR